MAPSRGRGRGKSSNLPKGLSRRAPQPRNANNSTIDVYQDMLDEAAVIDPEPVPDRPLKRRRLLPEANIPSASPSKSKQPASDTETGNESELANGLQTAQLSSDDEDESDFGFEDVDLGGPSNGIDLEDEQIGDISVPLNQSVTPKRNSQAKRKPATAVEKARRLLVHKAHVLCLLSHCIYVNSWINAVASDDSIAATLAGKAKTYFKIRQGAGQFEQNKTFMKGLQQAVEDFSARYTVTSSGMRKAQWDTETDNRADIEPFDKDVFFRAARKLEGSQDTGNQLFCAMLRSVGVKARIVCSLQPLPFASIATKNATPQKVVKRTVYAIASDTDPDKSEASADDTAITISKTIGKVPSARRRLGQPTFSPAPSVPVTPPQPKKAVRKLSYPVFWVEAFNSAHQNWVPVDPIVTGTINKAPALEPPGSYEHNQLSYAIAFEANCVAKDVTRRYAKAFNAKTRRQRVERTGDPGHAWWEKTMRFFRRRGGQLDRDQVEDAALAAKEAKEGMPANVQDFKDHPVYALERHLRRHEVIHPRREVGKANAGTAKNPRMEAVFRRRDVLVCKSAEKWYRSGRVVKEGEQPRKHLTAVSRQRRRTPVNEGDEEAEAERRTALYSVDQTDVYVPPPVSASGKIPRNAFGNLDIYVPSMVPAGGVHIRHPLASQAAQILKIDSADAVVGFSFKGRQGTAVIAGAVVAAQYAAAVRAGIEGLEYEAEQERCLQRSLVALKLWKRFLTGLRVKERLAAYGPGEKKDKKDGIKEQDFVEDPAGLLLGSGGEGEEELMSAGRYNVEGLVEMLEEAKRARKRAAENGKGRKRKKVDSDDEEEGGTDLWRDEGGQVGDGGFLAEDAETADPSANYGDGGFEIEDDGGGGGFAPEDDDTDGKGGGVVLDDDGGGGGLVVDNEPDTGDDGRNGAEPADDAKAEGGHAVIEAIDAQGHANNGGEGGGFIPDKRDGQVAPSPAPDAEGDTAMHGALPDRNRQESAVPPAAPRVAVAGKNNDDMRSMVDNDVENGADVDGGEGEGGVDAYEDDNGSLLSHDPEDDDAEPDWLGSD